MFLRVVGSGLFDKMTVLFNSNPKKRYEIKFFDAPFDIERLVRSKVIDELRDAYSAYLDYVDSVRTKQKREKVEEYLEK